jgi:hypothetical protein
MKKVEDCREGDHKLAQNCKHYGAPLRFQDVITHGCFKGAPKRDA